MIRFRVFKLSLSLSVLLLCLGGCSSNGDIGWVEGVVTLDGAPVDGANVRFYPTAGRGSSGQTDENGRYVLRYTRSAEGAVFGQHKVAISTLVEKNPYKPEENEARAETIPERYLDPETTELNATVESGNNKINFDLTSK